MNAGNAAAAAAGGALLPASLELEVPDLGAQVLVRSAELTEALFEPYACSVEIAIPESEGVLPPDLLGQNCALVIARPDHPPRRLCGIISRLEDRGLHAEHHLARILVVPGLALLRHRVDSRIFQEKTVPDILKDVFNRAFGDIGRKFDFEPSREYPKREYCVQYRESDLDFVSRLMEEEGITYAFDHEGDVETLKLIDTPNGWMVHQPVEPGPLPVAGEAAAVPTTEGFRIFERADELRATTAVLRDFDWTRPLLDLTFTSKGQDARERTRESYEYPGRLTLHEWDSGQHAWKKDDGEQRADLRREELEAGRHAARGVGSVTGLAPGVQFEVNDDGGNPQKWVVTRATHRGFNPASRAIGGADARVNADYVNEIWASPAEVPQRPPRWAPRPVIGGLQTAIVVGTGKEEIHVDEHGRVKVKFPWDRLGAKDDHASCWVRVAQPWAGASWGFQFLPRVGMEVVVAFLEGDPDRPLIVGAVYNGITPLPHTLPNHKTKSGIRTLSTPGGEGFNELSFEDEAGKEQIFLQAQRDLDEEIKRNHSAHVGGDQSLTVDGNQTISVKGKAQGDFKGSSTSVTGKYTVSASDLMHMKAPNSITLECGGSSIKLEPGKITLKSGGSAELVLDANAFLKSSAGSKVLLDANAHAAASGGGKVHLDANALVQGKDAFLQGDAAATVKAPDTKVGDGKVAIKGSAVNIDGGGATGSFSGGMVKLN